MCVYIFVFHTCMLYTCLYSIHVYMCMCVCICIYMYIYTYMYTCIQIYTAPSHLLSSLAQYLLLFPSFACWCFQDDADYICIHNWYVYIYTCDMYSIRICLCTSYIVCAYNIYSPRPPLSHPSLAVSCSFSSLLVSVFRMTPDLTHMNMQIERVPHRLCDDCFVSVNM